MDLNKVISVMEMVAINAGDMLMGIQPKSKRLETRKDFLTDADLKSEEIILRALASEYPDIPSFSEEKGLCIEAGLPLLNSALSSNAASFSFHAVLIGLATFSFVPNQYSVKEEAISLV